MHQSAKTTAWLCSFFTSCFRRSKLPKTWRRATIVALPKPNKPQVVQINLTALRPVQDYGDVDRPYTAASTLWWTHSFLGNKPASAVVDQRWTKQHYQHKTSKTAFSTMRKKAGVEFLDLTAASDTVWHRGLHLKLISIIPDIHMVGFIMNML